MEDIVAAVALVVILPLIYRLLKEHFEQMDTHENHRLDRWED